MIFWKKRKDCSHNQPAKYIKTTENSLQNVQKVVQKPVSSDEPPSEFSTGIVGEASMTNPGCSKSDKMGESAAATPAPR